MSIVVKFVVRSSEKMQTPDWRVSLPSCLLCVEMGIVAALHLRAYSHKPYVLGSKAHVLSFEAQDEAKRYVGGPFGIYAIMAAFNPWDIMKAIGRSVKWIFRDRKHRFTDASYATNQHSTRGIFPSNYSKLEPSVVLEEQSNAFLVSQIPREL